MTVCWNTKAKVLLRSDVLGSEIEWTDLRRNYTPPNKRNQPRHGQVDSIVKHCRTSDS